MHQRELLTLVSIVLEGIMYYAMLLIFKIPYYHRFLALFYVFQFIFRHYEMANRLIWAEMKNMVISHCVLFIVEVLFIDNNKTEIVSAGLVLLIMFVYEILLNHFLRILFRKQAADRILIIGVGEQAKRLIEISESNRFAMMNPIACIDISNHPIFSDLKELVQVKDISIYPYEQLDEVIKEHRINNVVIALPDATKEQIRIMMQDLFGKVPKIKYLPRVNSIITFDTEVEDFDGILILSSSGERKRIIGHLIKRGIDILAGIVGVMILIPLTLIIKYKSLKEGDRDSIFFTQERIGKNGEPITIYKYRSMVVNAEEKLEKMMREDEAIRREYLENKKLVNDPRITKIGQFIRRKSIDEFPQFINVLKGEMSLIGPRPYLYREIEDMGMYYKSIIKSKPGITGMWQANGRNEVSFHERCKLDDYYYRNWNIWLDFTIMYKTIKAAIYGKGAL